MSEARLEGQTFLVTGANTGIGRTTAEALAARGAHVLLACRSEEKTRPVLEAILAGRATGGGDAEYIALDLADLGSVKRCAADLLERDVSLHGLINNAGLAGLRGQTKQGFEVAFGTNHLGHFLLTTLLLPRVRAVSGRVVNVASKAHYDAKRIDWDALRSKTASLTGLAEYAVSKLCNVLFTNELARNEAASAANANSANASGRVRSYALHPGVVASDAWRQVPQPFRWLLKLNLLSNAEGAKTSLYCATSDEAGRDDGLYYDSCKTKPPSALALDAGLARKLWVMSEEWVSGVVP